MLGKITFATSNLIDAYDISSLSNDPASNFNQRWSMPLSDINQHCIELMVMATRHLTDSGGADIFQVLSAQITTLDPPAIERLASHPFLLANIQFQDELWWRETVRQPERQWHTTFLFRDVPRTAAIRLARATLVFAWHATRTHHDYAIALLGINPSLLEIIASLPLHDLDQIAEHQFKHLTPRWHDQLSVWKQLLDDAIHMSAITKSNCNLRSLQLFAGQHMKNHLATE